VVKYYEYAFVALVYFPACAEELISIRLV